MAPSVGPPDPRTVTGCGRRVLGVVGGVGLRGFAYLCTYYVRITYGCTYLRRSCRQTFASFEYLEEYLDGRVRKTTNYARFT